MARNRGDAPNPPATLALDTYHRKTQEQSWLSVDREPRSADRLWTVNALELTVDFYAC